MKDSKNAFLVNKQRNVIWDEIYIYIHTHISPVNKYAPNNFYKKLIFFITHETRSLFLEEHYTIKKRYSVSFLKLYRSQSL